MNSEAGNIRVYRVLNKNSLGIIFLAGSLTLNAGFVYWLTSETDAERAVRIRTELDAIYFESGSENATRMLMQALAKEPYALNFNWLPVLRKTRMPRSEKIAYYQRVLAGTVDREEIYMDIAELLKAAPNEFHQNVKPGFLNSLYSIPGIDNRLLDKYQLLSK